MSDYWNAGGRTACQVAIKDSETEFTIDPDGTVHGGRDGYAEGAKLAGSRLETSGPRYAGVVSPGKRLELTLPDGEVLFTGLVESLTVVGIDPAKPAEEESGEEELRSAGASLEPSDTSESKPESAAEGDDAEEDAAEKPESESDDAPDEERGDEAEEQSGDAA